MLHLVADHLWQSTLCVGIAWLLTLALRKNHASIRFWVWFAASMKFLVPFAALVALGTALPWRPEPVATNTPIEVFELLSQPFSTGVTSAVTADPQPEHWTLERLAATGLPVLWALGTLSVLGVWLARWRRIRTAVTAAAEDTGSHERQVLCRLAAERRLTPPALRLSPGAVEPAVVGVRRPVLLWPAGISSRLTDVQVEAILAHELAHVARRDNLLALFHMAVQAIFWFHPLVWFIGTRLIRERERACDEDVVRRSGQREAYAEGILRTCEHCIESSLPSVAGVTGADLKARVASIMRGAVRRPLGAPQRALLIAASVVVLGTPLILGAVTHTYPSAVPQAASGSAPALLASDLRFEVASVKANTSGAIGTQFGLPGGGRFTATNATARELVRMAYSTQDYKLVGLPDWTSSERFDIEALAGKDITLTGDPGKPSPVFLMLRSLLVDRFGLTLHAETREMPVYVLSHVRADRVLGPALTPSTTDCVAVMAAAKATKATPPSPPPPASDRVLCGSRFSPGRHSGGAMDMDFLSGFLSNAVGRAVLNRTGLTGRFDWVLEFRPDVGDPAGGTSPSVDVAAPPLLVALQEQLGLKLEGARAAVEVLVIDHVEQPSDNHADVPRVAATAIVAAQAQAGVLPPRATQSPTHTAASGRFDVASIKVNKTGGERRQGFAPGGRFSATMVSLSHLVQVAYTRRPFEERKVEGGPSWRDSVHFDIAATGSGDYLDAAGFPSKAFAMLKALLVERFRLSAHEEPRHVPAYALVLARRDGRIGPRLNRSSVDCGAVMASMAKGEKPKVEPGQAPPCSFRVPPGTIIGGAVTLEAFAYILGTRADRPVIDRTGLTGVFDVALNFSPDPTAVDPERRPALPTALQEQLGLRLEPITATIDVVVIERAEMPTEN